MNELAIRRDTHVAQADVDQMALRLQARFPEDARGAAAMEVARLALAYGLDPFLEELIPYQGRPYLTQKGMIRIADQSPAYEGFDVEPATEDERKAFRASDKEVILKCLVHRSDRKRPIVAWGRASYVGERNPVSASQAPEMAYKRAVHRALRAAFPVALPDLPDDYVTPEQVKMIHTIDNIVEVSDDQRRNALQDTFGVRSSTELTKDQASVYISGRIVDAQELGYEDGGGVQPDIDEETGEVLEGMPFPMWQGDEIVGFTPAGVLERDLPTLKTIIQTAPSMDGLSAAAKVARTIGLFSDPEVKGELSARKSDLAAMARL